MPRKYSLKFFVKHSGAPFIATIAMLMVFSAGLSAYHSLPKKTNIKKPKRYLASEDISVHKAFKLHQKLRPPIDVQITKHEIDGQIIRLTAEVKSSIDSNRVDVRWQLPQYVTVVSGSLITTINDLPKNETRIVEITLESNSEENQKIHVSALATYGNQVLSDTDQFNTTEQSEINEGIKKLSQRNKAYIEKREKLFE